jgi:predicted short-subunit dehydrogenase-like oxidoreductase (DUF2520 family)
MLTLNIIGAGKLGRTLARLWQQQNIFSIGSLCNRTVESAQAAREFIGGGQVVSDIGSMPDADCWLIATGDQNIPKVAVQLAEHLVTSNQNPPLVFHCSGALGAEILAPCKPAAIASAHPVHSFADPAKSVHTLAGSTVALEGDAGALTLLREAFAALDCELIELSAEQKTLYHAGSVFACNYFTALLDLSLQAFSAAGIDNKTALRLLRPIVLQTAHNNLTLGPQKSLTGPIARGDTATVEKQLHALHQLNPSLAPHYRQLGLACVQLAVRGGLSADTARDLNKILTGPQP